MVFDAHTLIAVSAMIALLLGMIMWVFSRLFKTYNGFNLIGMCMLCFALALISLGMIVAGHYPLPIAVPNTLGGIGLACLYSGIRHFRNIGAGRNAVTLLLVLGIAGFSTLFPHLVDDQFQRAMTSTILVGVLGGMSAFALFRHQSGPVRRYQILATAGIGLIQFTWILRIASVLLTAPSALFNMRDILQAATVLAMPLSLTTIAIAFMWGCIEKSEDERKAKAEDLERSNSFLKVMLDTIPLPVFYKGTDSRYITVNNAFCEVADKEEEEIVGMTADELFHLEDDHSAREHDEKVLDTMEPHKYETRLLYNDGLIHEALVNKSLVVSPAGDVLGIVGTITDITERKIHEAKISYMAMHDLLTGMPNRNLFFELTEKALAAARRDDGKLGLMYMDLDGFKEINDTHGHAVGDHVLRQIGQRLFMGVRQSDSTGRLGGDEFALMVPKVEAIEDLTAVAQKVIMNIVAPMSHQNMELTIGVSIGIAVYPDDAENLADLIKCADKAMYVSKSNGTNLYTFYKDLAK